MSRSWIKFLAQVIFAFFVTVGELFALDPSKAVTQYQLDVWTERNGLPQGSVQAITQTRDGYLWIATRDGLARFDGVTFTTFRSENSPGLPSNDIRALEEDRQGRLWIGTFNAGLSCYSNGQFRAYSKKDGLPGNGVLEIFEDSKGALWLSTWSGLARYDGRTFTRYGSGEGFAGRAGLAFCDDGEGRLCVASDGMLSTFKGDRFHELTNGAPVPDCPIQQMCRSADGALWIASAGEGVLRIHEGKVRRYTKSSGLADNKVASLLHDREGNVWVGTWSGLCRIQGQSIATLTRQDGLPHDYIESLYEDHEGSLWIGTRGGGLARLRDARISNYTTREGLGHNFAKCVFEDRNGAMWIGTHGGGLTRFHNGQVTTFGTDDGLPSMFVWSVGEDRDGNLWVGTGRPGMLSVYKDGCFTAHRWKHGLFRRSGVRAIEGDRDGNLWIGGDGGGLCRYSNGNFKCLSTGDGLPSNLIRVIKQDRCGDLWIGSNDGLARYRDGEFTTFRTEHGLAHNAVYAIFQDSEGALWIGTQDGLSRFSEDGIRSYTTRDGLFHNVIYHISEDRSGRLWMSSNRGIFSLPKQSFVDFDAGRARQLSCVSYGIADGMKAVQCEGGSQPAGCKATDGKLWFATANGVAVIDPDKPSRGLPVAPVIIEEVWAGKQKLDVSAPAKLPPKAREFRFEYTALSFAAPEKVKFRYKLEGVDDKWIDAGTRRVAFYNKIPPGNYKFRVMACNSEGVWNENGAVFAFFLAPHFYQTPWFYALCLVGLTASGWGLHRHRMKRAHDRFALVLAERTRIARELHDTLAQGFAGIAFQLEAVATKLKEAPEHARQHLEVALKMVRHSLAEARRSVMNLRSAALDNGDLATALTETSRLMLADGAVEFELRTEGIARPLLPKVENNLLRIGQEAITNAMKYSQARRIQVHLAYVETGVVLSVCDDGTGFEQSATASNGVHFGLLGMEERAKQMGAKLSVISRKGGGTAVTVEVPQEALRQGGGT
jgi:ligand-binding sensor domain-containing protein/signal transduction histidine kinase